MSVCSAALHFLLQHSFSAAKLASVADMTQRATVPRKWLRPNHLRNIPRPTGSVLSTQEILDPSVNYPVLYHHLELNPYPKAGLICHALFKELLYQENGCVPITYDTFQDSKGLSYPHMKYWTHRSIIQY